VLSSLLNLKSSCWSTVFIDYSYFTGCFLEASAVSKALGILAKIYFIFPLIRDSAETPAPPALLGKRVSTVSQIKSVSMIAEEI
jgi:hypothetical protein